MMRRLLDRNIAILVVVVLAGQLLAATLLYQLVMRPQTMRLAEMTAEMTDTIGKTMAHMSPAERRALVSRFKSDDAVLIRPGEQPPDIGMRRPTLIENEFIAAISHRLNNDQPVEWRSDTQSRLWVHLWLGGEDWWVSLTPRGLRTPMTSTLIALGSALFVAIAGGIVLQRIIDTPLRKLVHSVDDYDADRAGEPIAETGPQEIAAVAHAFNRMTSRLAAQEAERALMLGAVSHDLRTPLTRLRLSLAMLHGADTEMLESAGRQVDRIETMLTQFLDFARGFDSEAAEPVEIAPLLRRCADDARIGDDAYIDCSASLSLVARPVALERAITNLLGNARRYGCAPFWLEARVQEGQTIVSVGDSGNGFDPTLSKALSRPFARGDKARGGDGTGLGLAIVDRIAKSHGATLSFRFRDALFWAEIAFPGSPIR